MAKKLDIDYARCHDLTIGEIRDCSLFSHLTDDEALELIETLKIFTKITYDMYKKEIKIL